MLNALLVPRLIVIDGVISGIGTLFYNIVKLCGYFRYKVLALSKGRQTNKQTNKQIYKQTPQTSRYFFYSTQLQQKKKYSLKYLLTPLEMEFLTSTVRFFCTSLWSATWNRSQATAPHVMSTLARDASSRVC